MKRTLIALVGISVAATVYAATLNPISLLNPAGSSAGQVITSTGASTPPVWSGVSVSTASGMLPVANGGTGATTAAAARTNLGLGTVATQNTVPIANGGTGATSASAALTALGGAALAGSASQTFNVANASAASHAEAYGQSISSGTFQVLTASRAFGTTYTNSTGHPVFVVVTGLSTTAAATTLLAIVGGAGAAASPTTPALSGMYTSVSFLVPAGQSYSVTISTGTASLNIWSEVR